MRTRGRLKKFENVANVIYGRPPPSPLQERVEERGDGVERVTAAQRIERRENRDWQRRQLRWRRIRRRRLRKKHARSITFTPRQTELVARRLLTYGTINHYRGQVLCDQKIRLCQESAELRTRSENWKHFRFPQQILLWSIDLCRPFTVLSIFYWPRLLE